MFNWTLPLNHKAALADKQQTLTAEKPGTIGFEIEQLFYHGECLGPTIEIELRDNQKKPERHAPHTYLSNERPEPRINFLKDGAYSKVLASSDLVSITLDTTDYEITKRAHFNTHVTTYTEIAHVMEFITSPMTLTDSLKPALELVSNTITDLYIYCKNKHGEKSAQLDEWMNHYNEKEYAKNHPLKQSNDFTPKKADSGRSAHPVINLDTKEVEPLFAIHVNTSILLEQMYTPEMRNAFPIFKEYPALVKEAADMKLKDWPSTRPNPAFEAWELALTQNIYDKVNAFVDQHFRKDNHTLDDYALKRIAGYFRTILYSFIILAYCRSKVSLTHYGFHDVEWRYPKDFFLHGIAKIKLNNLYLKALTTREKDFLRTFAPEEDFADHLDDLFGNIMNGAQIYDYELANIRINEKQLYAEYSRYVYEIFTHTAISNKPNEIRLPVKVLDSTLPTIIIDGETVAVPVVEFRACEGNGCSLDKLEALLSTQADRAMAFAKHGFEQMPKPKASAGAGVDP